MKKIVTGDYRLVKHLNNQIVLNLIRLRGPIYGADLAKITGMRPSTIMNILRDLESKGFVRKAGIGNSTVHGGRRPLLYEICGDYGYIVGLKVELNEMQGILIDLNSRIIAKTMMPLEERQSIEQLVEKISRILDALIIPQNIRSSKLLGMGVGVSGIVDFNKGLVVKTDLVSEENVPLQEILQQRYPFKIVIENDANAAAMFEKWYHQGKDVSNFIYALLVIAPHIFGIGYGIIIDNQLYRGAHMFAGETNPHAIAIRQLLDRISGDEGVRILLAGKEVNKDEVDLNHLLAAASANDRIAKEYFVELAKIIGAEVAPVIQILDPEMILFAGEVMKAESILLPAIAQTVKEKIGDLYKVKFAASISEDAVALGVASLILQDVFKPTEYMAGSFLG